MDLIAEKLWRVSDCSKGTTGHVAVRLFIECKYLQTHSVIWVAEKDQHQAEKLVGRFLPLKSQEYRKHHYLCDDPVAKLFASGKPDRARNDGSELDPLYRAVNQVLNGMVSLRGRPVTHPDVARFGPIKKFFDYPVIICSSFDKMFAVEFYNDAVVRRVEQNFQLEIEYAYSASNGATLSDYFLLDFVSENRLCQFQQAVDDDVKAAERALRWQSL
jgi:hypothetical protein